jgi:hypothetical protein
VAHDLEDLGFLGQRLLRKQRQHEKSGDESEELHGEAMNVIRT